jgi:hypothetical protein
LAGLEPAASRAVRFPERFRGDITERALTKTIFRCGFIDFSACFV